MSKRVVCDQSSPARAGQSITVGRSELRVRWWVQHAAKIGARRMQQPYGSGRVEPHIVKDRLSDFLGRWTCRYTCRVAGSGRVASRVAAVAAAPTPVDRGSVVTTCSSRCEATLLNSTSGSFVITSSPRAASRRFPQELGLHVAVHLAQPTGGYEVSPATHSGTKLMPFKPDAWRGEDVEVVGRRDLTDGKVFVRGDSHVRVASPNLSLCGRGRGRGEGVVWKGGWRVEYSVCEGTTATHFPPPPPPPPPPAQAFSCTGVLR